MEIFLNDKLGKISVDLNEAKDPRAVMILAHGAGAGMHHPFMTNLAQLISAKGITVARFNFPYMEQGRKSPGSPKSNILCWEMVLDRIEKQFQDLPIFIAGKSYGGRMGSHLLADSAQLRVKGIIYFGFPLHAPGKDSLDRAAHLKQLKVPQLFLQGEKDKLANIELMQQVVGTLEKSQLETIAYADHSFHVPKKSGTTNDEVLKILSEKAEDWMNAIIN